VISRRIRVLLTGVGGSAWVAGAAATFLGGNGSGAVALIVSGVAAVLFGLMGRWPQRIAISGNEVGWDEVRRAVETSIEASESGSETSSAAQELRTLLYRLERLEQTGTVPEHPAIAYDRAVQTRLQRLFPGREILSASRRSRDVPDFTMDLESQRLLVETKWRQDVSRPMEGSTLPRLRGAVGTDGLLLVVSNATDVSAARAVVEQLFDGRARIVSWRDVRDDDALAEAVRMLLAG
jgi:hypothetical protein